ncbi:MAG TPA: hypothetical protein VN253_01470 [Kofleriaceae bacterium]|nr:hypothetical protein [Kofleriaceae bacterium]
MARLEPSSIRPETARDLHGVAISTAALYLPFFVIIAAVLFIGRHSAAEKVGAILVLLAVPTAIVALRRRGRRGNPGRGAEI